MLLAALCVVQLRDAAFLKSNRRHGYYSPCGKYVTGCIYSERLATVKTLGGVLADQFCVIFHIKSPVLRFELMDHG